LSGVEFQGPKLWKLRERWIYVAKRSSVSTG
jgi:hypothetical protein